VEARLVLIGVDHRTARVARLEGGPAGGVDESHRFQFLESPDVDRAPDAPLPPRRDALRRAAVALPVTHAVDPAEAERLVDQLLPGHRGKPGALVEVADPELGRRLVVGLEPLAQLGPRLEEDHVVGRWHW